jgi:two-component sensor histidine kinase/streptogramin lyase
VDEGPDGSLWVATADGIARLNKGRWTREAHRTRDDVWSILADRRGRVWMRSGGFVDVLESGRVRRTSLRVSPVIRSGTFYEDRAGHVWIAASGGVYREEEGGRIAPVPLSGHPDDARPLSLLETRDGALWVGEMRGLLELRDGAPTLHTTPDRRLGRVVTLHEDATGTLWAGTWGGGLCRRANGAFRCFAMSEGLPSNNVYQILEDDRQTLWLSSSRGVARVRKEDIQAFEDGRRKTIAATLYGMADGLPTSMCRGDSQPAGLKTRDGLLFFPTAKGLAWVDPQQLDRMRGAPSPPVVVQRLVVDGAEIALPREVRLPPGRRRFEVQFAGLSFRAPSSVRYRYKLDGFDRDWVEADQQTAAQYTGLRPGRYLFRVSASNKEGLWSATDAVLPFELAPYFYETWWFALAVAGGLVALVGSGHALRMGLARRRFETIFSERLRLARELHDSLEQELAALTMPMQILRKRLPTPEAREPIDAMSAIVARCALSVSAAIWDLRSGHDLAGELRTIAERLADGRAITVAVEVEGTPTSLPERVQRQLLRIGQEALTNAVRHASPRNIRIQLQVAPRCVRLRLRDDGCGFEVGGEEGRLGHFGLVGMRERVQELKGELRVTSQIGVGTEVAVDVALG